MKFNPWGGNRLMGLADQVAQLGYPPAGRQNIAFGAAGAALAITLKEGTVTLSGAGVVAATLALPVSGEQSAGGDNGKVLTIIGVSAQAHTVTTPAAGLNAASTTLTYQAAIGNGVQLVAFNGSWMVLNATNDTTPNVVIS